VVEAVADALGAGRGAVRITSGPSSRWKVVEIDGEESALSVAWEDLLRRG
jgi:uncharacterized protein YggU (UPF0235/DUF167 family)